MRNSKCLRSSWVGTPHSRSWYSRISSWSTLTQEHRLTLGCTSSMFLPSGSPDVRLEQVGLGDALGRPNELLLLLRKVSAEILRALRTQPDTSIHDFDMGEDVGRRELGLLRLRCFIGVRSERADINQPDNAIVGSGAGDDASAVRVADEDNGAADPAYRCFHQGDVLCRCVEAVLRCNTLIPLRLKWNDQLAETRAIGPESVAKHDAWFGLRRCHFLLLIDVLSSLHI